MSKLSQPLRLVNNVYGTRETGGAVGRIANVSTEVEYTFDLTVEAMTSDLFEPMVIPADSKVKEVYVYVDEAFVITTGTTKGYIGEAGNEDTNGIQLDDTVLETAGIYKLATGKLLGTFNDASSYISANTELGFDIGTLDPSGTSGKARVVIKCLRTAV